LLLLIGIHLIHILNVDPSKNSLLGHVLVIRLSSHLEKAVVAGFWLTLEISESIILFGGWSRAEVSEKVVRLV